MKILGALLELPAKQHCQSSPFTSKLGQIGQIGSNVKSIATFAPTFYGYIISVLASVLQDVRCEILQCNAMTIDLYFLNVFFRCNRRYFLERITKTSIVILGIPARFAYSYHTECIILKWMKLNY